MPFFIERELPPPIEPVAPVRSSVVNWWSGGVKTYDENYKPDGDSVEWETAYGLVFRSPFPGTRGLVSAIGRVSLELSSIRDTGLLLDELIDPNDNGDIFLCNRKGRIIASLRQGMQSLIQKEDGRGRLRHRYAWELQYAW